MLVFLAILPFCYVQSAPNRLKDYDTGNGNMEIVRLSSKGHTNQNSAKFHSGMANLIK